VHVEDPAFLQEQPDVAAAEKEKADKAAEKAATKKGEVVPETPANAAEHIHCNNESQQGDPADPAADAFVDDSEFFGEDTALRGAYCCCCLPCGSCKRGRACHCLVANKACCGSVQPALPRLRNELLRTNALLSEKRIRWWRTAKAQEVAARGVEPILAAVEEEQEDADKKSKKNKKKSPKVQKGGTGFITFRTARQAVTAANSYHLPNTAFDVPRKAKITPGTSAVAPSSTTVSAVAGPALKKRSAAAVAVEALTGNQHMTVVSAPRPADINYASSTKTTKEQTAAQRVVFLLRTTLLVVYSLLAIAVANGGGEGSDEEGDNIAVTLYNGLGQSFLLTVLLSLLPTILGIFAKLSHFKVINEVSTGMFLVAPACPCSLFPVAEPPLHDCQSVLLQGLGGHHHDHHRSGKCSKPCFCAPSGRILPPLTPVQSLQATLSRLAEEPFSIIEVLGNDLPKFASFYVSFILLKALADLPRTLLQVGGLVQFGVRFGQGPDVKAMYRAMRGKGVPGATIESGVLNMVLCCKYEHFFITLLFFVAGDSPAPTCAADSKDAPTAAGDVPMLAHASSSAYVSSTLKAVPTDPSVPAVREDLMAQTRKFHIAPRQFVRLVINGGGSFNYPAAISDVLFVILIGFIFGAMVPILPPLIALTMAVMGMVYKYQLVYRMERAPDSGAAFTPGIINRLAFALGLMQAVVAAMLFVRENIPAGVVTLIPLLATRVFIGTVNTRILATADLLSLREAVEGDEAHGRMGPPPAAAAAAAAAASTPP